MQFGELVKKLKNGDQQAFKHVVFTYSSKLMTVARIYNNSLEDAKDALQDAFVVVHQKMKMFEGDSEKAFLAWVKRIIINISLSKNQRMYKRMEGVLDTKIHHHFEDAKVIGKLTHDEIMNLIFDLPDGYRQVFSLYAIEGYSHKEIADQLGIKESSSRSKFMRSRRMLQFKINDLMKIMIT